MSHRKLLWLFRNLANGQLITNKDSEALHVFLPELSLKTHKFLY